MSISRHDADPLAALLDAQGFAVLDGGLATTLEARGHVLDDDLWSARLLLEDPAAIRDVHRDFLAAGADVIVAATYQATLEGFVRRGLDAEAAAAALRAAVDLAVAARDGFAASPAAAGRARPLVAAGIGPYGAYLADGSEFTGAYDLDAAGLRAFHAGRWGILAATPADLLACETIPSLPETAALLSLLDDTPGRTAWLSFSCRDDRRLRDGAPLAEAVRLCAAHDRVAAVGVNCTAPAYVEALIREARGAADLPVVVYPNSGETWDAEAKAWGDAGAALDWATLVPRWRAAGAAGFGGCCRVGPDGIAAIRRALG